MKKNLKYSERELFKKLREKYSIYDLDSIEGCQSVLVLMLKENNGNIITNRAYHLLDKKCQELIFEAEMTRLPFALEYRSRQDLIEKLADKFNKPTLSKEAMDRKGRVNIILKNRYYHGQPKKCHFDLGDYGYDR